MILTNSAGGALKGMIPGSIMVIEDHIRLCHVNPLNDISHDRRFLAEDKRYLDSTAAYDAELMSIAVNAGQALNLSVLKGTYNWTGGPTYETPAEVRAGRIQRHIFRESTYSSYITTYRHTATYTVLFCTAYTYIISPAFHSLE
jgi:purine nucleoside phosphorylase